MGLLWIRSVGQWVYRSAEKRIFLEYANTVPAKGISVANNNKIVGKADRTYQEKEKSDEVKRRCKLFKLEKGKVC